jgi:hypothetical protein
MDIGSKNPESLEQNRVKRLSGWDPNEVAWVELGRGRFLEMRQVIPLFYLVCG